MAKCAKCGKEKPQAAFCLNRTLTRGFDYYCKQCRKEMHKKYRKDNAEAYLKKARDKSSKEQHTTAISLTGKCAFCRAKGKTSRHHLIPREFGDDSKNNLVELCWRCHLLAHRITTRILWELTLHKKKVV